MGRRSTPPAQIITTDFDTPAAASTVAELQHGANAHALAVADVLGGEMMQYSREECRIRLRGLMAQGTQVMLEIGRTLIWVREHEPEAEFGAFLADAQLERRMAYKFMQAAQKFVLGLTDGQREAMGALSRSKLFELVVLDDDEIRELADGGTVAGITRDDVDTMSTSELRASLRESRRQAKADEETKARQLDAKNEKLDKLEAEIDRLTHGTPDEQKRAALEREAAAVKRVAEASLAVLGVIATFDQALSDVLALGTPTSRRHAEETTAWLFHRLADVAAQRGMLVDFAAIVMPDWVAGMTSDELADAIDRKAA